MVTWTWGSTLKGSRARGRVPYLGEPGPRGCQAPCAQGPRLGSPSGAPSGEHLPHRSLWPELAADSLQQNASLDAKAAWLLGPQSFLDGAVHHSGQGTCPRRPRQCPRHKRSQPCQESNSIYSGKHHDYIFSVTPFCADVFKSIKLTH